MHPSSKRAERAVSAKVFMPLLDDKRLVLPRKLLRVRKLPYFQTNRLAQFDHGVHVKYGLAPGITDVDVDRPMLVAVEKESVAILFKDFGHGTNSPSGSHQSRANHEPALQRAAGRDFLNSQLLLER